ncbi:hypothetical protein GCM10027181_36090 [Rheinheimera gaetbuli]
MDNLVAFFFDTIWIVSFALAMVYNIARRSDLKPVIWLAGILTVCYAVNHAVTAAVFDGKAFSEHITFQYVLWSAACGFIVAAVLLAKVLTSTRLYWMAKVVIGLLCVDTAGNILMHVDQNIVALNDWGPLNNDWANDRWALWYWYSAQSNINNALMLSVLFFPVGVEGALMRQANNIKRVFKSLLNGFNFFSGIGGLNGAYNRITVITDMIEAMPESERHQASNFLTSAQELIYRMDETGQCHLEGINLLLDAAAHCAMHCPASASSTNIALQTKGS